MPALRGDHRRFETGRAGADHEDTLATSGATESPNSPCFLQSDRRVVRARQCLVHRYAGETPLLTADTRTDVLEASLTSLIGQLRIRYSGLCHSNHVGVAIGENLLRH